MATWEQRRPFLDVLRGDPEVLETLGEERLAVCFDLKSALGNADHAVRALDALDAPWPG